MEEFTVTYTRWVIKWRWLVLFVTLLLASILASGVRFLEFDTEYKAFFKPDDPQLIAFEKLQDIYTKNSNILFVVAPKNGEVFTAPVLHAVEELTREAWKIPYAIRVNAVTNFQHTRASDDELIVADLVSDALHRSTDELETARKIAVVEPSLRKKLISPTAHVTGINVTLQRPGEDTRREVPKAVNYARQLAESIQAEHPGIDIHLTGLVLLNYTFAEVSKRDIRTLVPFMYAGMIGMMFLLLRSVSGTLATVLMIILSSATAMGIAGWFRVGLTPPSAQAPTMIMTLAVADSIHILMTMLRNMRSGMSKHDALAESLRINMQPVFLTSLTTAIGFLSMNLSEVPPFRHLGNITAVGMVFSWIYAILFLPALMAILPVRVRIKAGVKRSLIDQFADFVIGRRQQLLWGASLAVLFLVLFLPRNELNDQFVNYFDEHNEFRADTDFTMQNLTGIYQVEFSLSSGESRGICNPEYLSKLEEFTHWYENQPNVLQVGSFSQVMKRLNKSMHGDDPDFYRIPASRQLAAQYLLLYEMSLPFGLDLNNQIDIDKSATRFIITLANVSTREIREIASRGERWLAQNAPEYMFNHGVGPSVMFAYVSGRNIEGMLKGTLIALLLISLTLVFALRSFKFGAISLVPNLIPAAVGFGLWGLLVGKVNLGLSIVTGMTLGIVVDDTVHFLSKYLRARRERELPPEGAIRYAFSSVGKAMLGTSLILIVGFAVLSFSTFDMNGSMGRLTAITILFALLADFLLLPPLLMRVERKRAPKILHQRIQAAEDVLVSLNYHEFHKGDEVK